MDEDQILQSIIADPQLTDPSIDTSGLRTATDTRAELLANVPEFSGLKFDPTQRSYIKDLYSVYGGGLPTIPEPVVEDTTPDFIGGQMIETGGGGGGIREDQVAGDSVLGTTPQDFGQSLVNQGIGVQATPTDPVGAAFEEQLTSDVIDDFNAIAVTPQTFADTGRADLLDQAGNVPGVGFATDFFPDINTNVGTTQQVATFGDTTTGLEDYVEDIDLTTGLPETPNVAFDRATIANVAGPVTLSQQDLIDSDANVGFEDVPTLEAEDLDTSGNLLQSGIDKIKSIIPNFDPIKAGAKLAFNNIIGKPVSLVFDLLQAAGLEGGRGEFSDELANEYGMDDIGRLTSGPMEGYSPVAGNIVEAAQERIDNIENRTAPQTEASIQKVQELNEFVQKATQAKADIAAPQEDIGAVSGDTTTGADPTTGNLPGGGNIADEFGSDGDTGRTTGPTVSRSDADYGQFGRQQSVTAADSGSSGGGGGKIVCTMMNESYGFGSFRNKIWLKHSKSLAPEYQKGYHKIFLPLVKLSKTNKLLKKTLEHIAMHRTIDIRQESRGKVHLLGRVYRKILEPICYWVGKYAKR